MAVVIATACAPEAAPVPRTAPAPSLIGEWRVVAVNGRRVAGKASIVPPLFKIDFGCNWGRSGFRIDGPALIPVMPFSTTERGCVTLGDGPSPVMGLEQEGFRIAARPMRSTFYGPDFVRLANEAGTIDLKRP